ncbi:hypothetical protein [Thermoactinomyces vulgaris]|nr:hypothetical protein [Thermoactinomyces vulgaris]
MNSSLSTTSLIFKWIEYLLKNHPAGSDKKIQKEELLKLIA